MIRTQSGTEWSRAAFCYLLGDSMSGRAFSLVELILVLGIMGAVAVMAVPRLPWQVIDRAQARVTARTLMTDLRRTRALALSHAAQSPAGFRLLFVGGYPHAACEIQEVGSGVVHNHFAFPSSVEVTSTGGTSFTFGPLGSLVDGSATGITIAGNGRRQSVSVEPDTGCVYLERD